MYAPYNNPTPTETHAEKKKNIERNKRNTFVLLYPFTMELKDWVSRCADDIDHEMDDHKNCCCSTIIDFEWYGKKSEP